MWFIYFFATFFFLLSLSIGPRFLQACTRLVNMPRFCVNYILKILSVLNVLSFEYAKVLNV